MRSSLLLALGALVPTLVAAQTRPPRRNTISLDEARALLKTNPVALPDVPILWISRQSSYSIMIHQQPDSGPPVTLVENSGEYRLPPPEPALGTARSVDAVQRRYDARHSTRVFPGVTVWLVGGGTIPVRYDLLERLQPIPPGTTPGATQSAPPPR